MAAYSSTTRKHSMAPRGPLTTRDAAEALFSAPKKDAASAVEKRAIPGTKELVSLKIDSDVLAHFQEDGPGWQERINDVLRAHVGGRRRGNLSRRHVVSGFRRGTPLCRCASVGSFQRPSKTFSAVGIIIRAVLKPQPPTPAHKHPSPHPATASPAPSAKPTPRRRFHTPGSNGHRHRRDLGG